LWRLKMFLLILATIVGFGSSIFVSLMIIYFIRKRKNQPPQK
jgi:preprotein translocase subunit SecF